MIFFFLLELAQQSSFEGGDNIAAHITGSLQSFPFFPEIKKYLLDTVFYRFASGAYFQAKEEEQVIVFIIQCIQRLFLSLPESVPKVSILVIYHTATKERKKKRSLASDFLCSIHQSIHSSFAFVAEVKTKIVDIKIDMLAHYLFIHFLGV